VAVLFAIAYTIQGDYSGYVPGIFPQSELMKQPAGKKTRKWLW
jgi:hypothetical protein